MPTKTIYIKAADVSIFKKASKLFGKSISQVIADALRKKVNSAEAKRRTRKSKTDAPLEIVESWEESPK